MEGGEVKLRSVCDACTSAKLRCNGKKPCERCLKKGVECNYQPYKNRGGNAKSKNSHRHQGDLPDTFLDDHERKTWSVFFTLYRSFGKGCSLYWFTNQLFRMLRFLEKKATKDDGATNAYNRLKSWMTALGLDVNASPPVTDKKPLAHLPFPSTNPPSFALTLDELRSEALRRSLPMLEITKEGVVELNDAFTVAFAPSQGELQKIVSECGGGFLPWSGDVLARILARESDLVLYLQAVSNTMDAIGRPPGFPSVQVVPTMNVLKVIKKDGQEALCIVRAVQQLMLDTDDGTNVNAIYSSTIVLELSDMGYNYPQNSRVRPFSETSMANEEKFIEHEFKKMLESEPETTIPLPQDVIDASDDDEWLEGLLTWANEDFNVDEMSVLPISDDMVGISAQKQN